MGSGSESHSYLGYDGGGPAWGGTPAFPRAVAPEPVEAMFKYSENGCNHTPSTTSTSLRPTNGRACGSLTIPAWGLIRSLSSVRTHSGSAIMAFGDAPFYDVPMVSLTARHDVLRLDAPVLASRPGRSHWTPRARHASHHLHFGRQHGAVGRGGRVQKPSIRALRLWLPRFFHLAGFDSDLSFFHAWLARVHSRGMVRLALVCGGGC